MRRIRPFELSLRKSASSPTGPLSSALTEAAAPDDALVVRTPVRASRLCRIWFPAVGRRWRTTLAGSVDVLATSAREARTFDG